MQTEFRVWDKQEKKMLYSPSCPDLWLDFDGSVYKHHRTATGECAGFKSVSNRYIRLQYIGFLIKNNKKLYRGDIITNEKRDYKWIIEFDTGRFFGKTLNPLLYFDWFFTPINVREIIQLGNIFENPEILDQEIKK